MASVPPSAVVGLSFGASTGVVESPVVGASGGVVESALLGASVEGVES
jgi:hypothetical protein